MKMTQKERAFYEYGKSIDRLIEAWNFVRKFPTPSYLKDVRYTDSYIPDIPSKGFLSFMDFLEDARKKRAICKAWSPPKGRDCTNCLHCEKTIGEEPCFSCISPSENNNWEPNLDELNKEIKIKFIEIMRKNPAK